MTPIIGYSDTRINSIDSSQKKEEFDKWLYSSNFKSVKAAAAAQDLDNKDRKSFASYLKSANANRETSPVVLKPRDRSGLIDIDA